MEENKKEVKVSGVEKVKGFVKEHAGEIIIAGVGVTTFVIGIAVGKDIAATRVKKAIGYGGAAVADMFSYVNKTVGKDGNMYVAYGECHANIGDLGKIGAEMIDRAVEQGMTNIKSTTEVLGLCVVTR